MNRFFLAMVTSFAALDPFAAFAGTTATTTTTPQTPPQIPIIPQDNQAVELDRLIKEFTDARDLAAAQAYDAGSEADQFLDQSIVDYEQAIRKQEMYQQQVKDLDEKIKQLQLQRAALPK